MTLQARAPCVPPSKIEGAKQRVLRNKDWFIRVANATVSVQVPAKPKSKSWKEY